MKRDLVADLARDLYPVIRPCASQSKGRICYQDVCARLHSRWPGLEPDSVMLAAALGLIVEACRVAGLPALSAVVVHKGGDRMPGNGYFEAAHPDVDDPLLRPAAWAREFDAVHTTTYPEDLQDLHSDPNVDRSEG
jgi:hypothetical protein